MKTTFRVFVLLLLAGGWALATAAVHVVRKPGPVPYLGAVTIVPKTNLSYHETWVDTTHWTPLDLVEHKTFVARVESAGRGDVLKHVLDTGKLADKAASIAAGSK